MKLSLIGLGLLGSALAERLFSAGFDVFGFDIAPDRLEAFSRLGGHPAPSAGAAAQASRILLCLPDTPQVEEVLAEIVPRLDPGTVVIDTTTRAPRETSITADRLAPVGVTYVEAPLLGSSEDVRGGRAFVLTGGPRDVVQSCSDVFRAIARDQYHVGPVGAAATTKLVVNLVLGLHRAVLAEGLRLAEKSGLDPRVTLDILRAGAAYSRVMDTKGDKMLARDFTPQARLAQHLKDVGLIADLAAAVNAQIPLSNLHRQLLESLVAKGHGPEDNSAILRAFL